MPAPPNFNPIARPYRWLEYLTLGSALERCRLTHLLYLLHARNALALGDGDGRFLARLLAANPRLQATAVDLSPAMLQLLRRRAHTAGASLRLSTHAADALAFQPRGPYDLVVTHFFLDCLTEPQLQLLLARLRPHLAPGALWLVSDFRIPPRGPLRLPARLLVRLLYLAFRTLTGLRTTHLPNHAAALRQAGLTHLRRNLSLGGILTTELWQLPSIQPSSPKENPMTTPSPVPNLPSTPGTDLPDSPVGPYSDPIPSPEPPSPSTPEPDPGVFADPSPS